MTARTGNKGPWLKNPKLPRDGEVIGAGWFVFRRGNGTRRIRPAVWPFEHATLDAAIAEADRLSAEQPGYTFEIFCKVCHAFTPKQDAAE